MGFSFAVTQVTGTIIDQDIADPVDYFTYTITRRGQTSNPATAGLVMSPCETGRVMMYVPAPFTWPEDTSAETDLTFTVTGPATQSKITTSTDTNVFVWTPSSIPLGTYTVTLTGSSGNTYTISPSSIVLILAGSSASR